MKNNRKVKPFKAWLVVDDEGTYIDSLHLTRWEAVGEKNSLNTMMDAKARVVPVMVTPNKTKP